MTREILENILTKKYKTAKKCVEDVLAEKIMMVLEEAKIHIVDDVFNLDEDVENLDELSKKTMGNYIGKALSDVKDAQYDIGALGTKHPEYKAASKLRAKRTAGIGMAVRKLTKEDVENLDELSQEKLKSYHAKAGADRMKAKGDVEKHGLNNSRPSPASVQKATDAYKRFIKRGKGMSAAANRMEDVEHLDELSGGTIGSYLVKSAKDKGKLTGERNAIGIKSAADIPAATKKSNYLSRKISNRGKGISRALDKLTGSSFARVPATEDVEHLDELSRKTLGSYIRKASDSYADKAAELTVKRKDADEVDRFTNRHMPDKHNQRDKMKSALGAGHDDMKKVDREIGKRYVGIKRATSRLEK